MKKGGWVDSDDEKEIGVPGCVLLPHLKEDVSVVYRQLEEKGYCHWDRGGCTVSDWRGKRCL